MVPPEVAYLVAAVGYLATGFPVLLLLNVWGGLRFYDNPDFTAKWLIWPVTLAVGLGLFLASMRRKRRQARLTAST